MGGAMSRPVTPDQRRALIEEVKKIYGELAGRPLERQCTGRAARDFAQEGSRPKPAVEPLPMHATLRTPPPHTHTHTPGGGSQEQVGGGFFLVSAS
jgi:hypothetical protein